MNKYIIKNCPAVYIFKSGYSCNNLDYDEHKFCKDVTDCLLKRIVELCNKIKPLEISSAQKQLTNVWADRGYVLAQDILNLLEIEEVDEEK